MAKALDFKLQPVGLVLVFNNVVYNVEDLAAEPSPDPDPVQRRYHMVTVARAARQALAS